MDGGQNKNLVECPRCHGGKMQPFMGEYEVVVGCRLCLQKKHIPAYLAAAYRLASYEVAPAILGPFPVEELRCQVEGRQSSHKK